MACEPGGERKIANIRAWAKDGQRGEGDGDAWCPWHTKHLALTAFD